MNAGPLKGVSTIFLKPCEVHFTRRAEWVETILGSCVAITMRHKEQGFSAVCHAMLPWYRPGAGRIVEIDKLRFVDTSIEHMVARFQHRGIFCSELEAKMFGGACTFSSSQGVKESVLVGKNNVAAALETLDRFGIVLAAQDTGGTEGRRIYFNTGTGEVLLKRIGHGQKD